MRRTVLFILALSCAALTGGCIMAGYAASIAGPPTVPATYLPAKKPMIVMVKDAPDPMGLTVDSDSLAIAIERQIKAYDIAPLVPFSKARDIRSFAAMTPGQLGRAAGADQVLYVQILSTTIGSEGDTQTIRGLIEAKVSIIDANTGTILWPTDASDGAIITHSTPLRRIADQVSPVTVQRSLLDGLAVRIGQLFRSYKPES